ncbi:MAG: putative CXXCH cytochrome family protein [Moritella sp.]|jgi:predicted CXXCH cytochrome family protein
MSLRHTPFHICLICISIFVFFALINTNAVAMPAPKSSVAQQYMGNESCSNCHQAEVDHWLQSDHAKAMQQADNQTVLGDFSKVKFESKDGWTIFGYDEQGYYIITGKKGVAGKRYPVPYVFGYYPLQQPLVDIGEGRLQAYTVAWDSRSKAEGGQRWYNLYDATHSPEAQFYWKGQFNNWNARCAGCHSTDLKRQYQPNSGSYKTTWSEINVSCEACHGPAEKHIQLKTADKSALNSGFAQSLKRGDNWLFQKGKSTAVRDAASKVSLDHGQVGQCAACHSRRSTFSGNTGDGVGGSAFSANYIPRLAIPDLYHADGQIQDEVYVYGSFTQSKMAAAGVTCSNCHDPHSGKVRAQDNSLCTQCHRESTFDVPAHTLHESGSDGSQCVDCHMPTKRYMGVDDRRDHAFRVPNPWVNNVLDSPDVCLSCHKEEDSEWSQQQLIAKKALVFGDYSDIGAAVMLYQQDFSTGEKRIRELIQDTSQPPMRRAVLLGHLNVNDPINAQILNILANDEQNLVKLGVISALERAPFPLQLQIGFGLLYDDDNNIRLQAIKLLAPAFRRELPEKAQKPMQDALQEAVATYQQQGDLLSAQLALADLAYKIGDLKQAALQYLNAITIQPAFLPAKLNLASIYREMSELSKSKALLDEILDVEPEHAMALHNVGLIYIARKQWKLATSALKRAAELEPSNPRFGYVYVLVLEASGNIPEAIKQVNRLEQITPGDPALKDLETRLQSVK